MLSVPSFEEEILEVFFDFLDVDLDDDFLSTILTFLGRGGFSCEEAQVVVTENVKRSRKNKRLKEAVFTLRVSSLFANAMFYEKHPTRFNGLGQGSLSRHL